MPQESVIQQIFEQFHGEHGSVCVRCDNKYQRAKLLNALQERGVDVNKGLNRSHYLYPDSPNCDFEFPHVRFYGVSGLCCTSSTPGDDSAAWITVDTLLEFLNVHDDSAEQVDLPDIPNLF